MPRVAIATCRPLPEPDPDEVPLRDALRDRGVEARAIVWHSTEPADDPATFDACVIRSTWDYSKRPDEFARWIERTGARTRLLNPAPVCLWNLHKGYLREIERAGIGIVPSAWCAKGQSLDIARLMDERAWERVVVKPQISAASWLTRRFDRDQIHEAQAFLDGLSRERDAMVQQYIESVERSDTRERSLVWIAGELTHVIAKNARFDAEHESVSQAMEASREERARAAHVLESIPFDPAELLYARIDLMTADDGTPLLSELELLEPSLFLVQHPPALARLAKAIAGIRVHPS